MSMSKTTLDQKSEENAMLTALLQLPSFKPDSSFGGYHYYNSWFFKSTFII
jgi:hypothetical protein